MQPVDYRIFTHAINKQVYWVIVHRVSVRSFTTLSRAVNPFSNLFPKFYLPGIDLGNFVNVIFKCKAKLANKMLKIPFLFFIN